MRTSIETIVGAAAIAGAVALAPNVASAQDSGPPDGAVQPTAKGMVGGGLLGAEVVMIGIAIGGVKAWWPYVVFGAVGAGAGVAGGYFVETEASTAEPSLYMLAGGMALVVPTLVAVLNATAYEPEDDEEDDDLPGDDEIPGIDVEAGVETGLLHINAFDETRVGMGVPAVKVMPSYTHEQMAKYGVDQDTEVHVPVVSARF